MISYNNIKKGSYIIINKEPFVVIESAPLFKGRGHSVLQCKVKSLINGAIYSKTFHPSDSFEEPEINIKKLKFIYCHRGSCFFNDESNKRIEIREDVISQITDLMKQGQEVSGIEFEGKIVNISLPIKINLKVKESPPGIKAGRAESGTKQVILETGAKINAPLFIKEGDVLEINTETRQYVRRVS